MWRRSETGDWQSQARFESPLVWRFHKRSTAHL